MHYIEELDYLLSLYYQYTTESI